MVDIDALFSGPGQVDGKTRYASFTLRTQCAHCGGPMPLVGPLRAVVCGACAKSTTVTAREWASIIKYAAASSGSMNIGSHEVVNGKPAQEQPACASCSALMPLEKLEAGKESTVRCGCGATLTAFPAPAWLKAELPRSSTSTAPIVKRTLVRSGARCTRSRRLSWRAPSAAAGSTSAPSPSARHGARSVRRACTSQMTCGASSTR